MENGNNRTERERAKKNITVFSNNMHSYYAIDRPYTVGSLATFLKSSTHHWIHLGKSTRTENLADNRFLVLLFACALYCVLLIFRWRFAKLLFTGLTAVESISRVNRLSSAFNRRATKTL